MAHDIPVRTLGRTGEQVSAIGLGGWHLALPHVDETLAIRIVRSAIDAGISFLDNSWDYNDGASETRMGKALADGYRGKAFLMTKIDGRSRAAATRQLDESLRRLRTDYVDLVQHHEILRFEDPHRIFDEDGAHGALLDAQRAGKLRYIGFTGHKDPRIHLYTLDVAREQGMTFDTVQMPLNVMDAHYRSFEQVVLPRLVQERIGVLGMKPLANGIILRSRTVSALTCPRRAPATSMRTRPSRMASCRRSSARALRRRRAKQLRRKVNAVRRRGAIEGRAGESRKGRQKVHR